MNIDIFIRYITLLTVCSIELPPCSGWVTVSHAVEKSLVMRALEWNLV